MMPTILGKKVGMTQVYDEQGVLVPVTVIQAGPCKVTQVKTVDTDGYIAMQLGYGDVKASRRKKPLVGHFAKSSTEVKRFVREVRTEEPAEKTAGDELTVADFEEVAFVDVTGTSKGKGFAGVVKRYGFKGQPASHGVERKHRSPGSIAVSSGNTGRSIKKGKRMSGRMGTDRCTSKNHKLVGIDQEHHLLLVKGSVPGPADGYVIVSKAKTKKASK